VHNDRELRIYLAVRTDLALGRMELAAQSARATWFALRAAARRGDPAFGLYDLDLQPKIGLRAKTEGVLARAEDEARAAGLSTGVARLADGRAAVLGIGPVCRAALPSFVGKLQLLADAGPEAPSACQDVEFRDAIWLFVREDAGIPYGKLAAQAGHGLWGAAGSAFGSDDLEAWHAAGAPVVARELPDLPAMELLYAEAEALGLPSSFVVDAGRTVFARPTPTVVGIGPCPVERLPQSAMAFLGGERPAAEPR
jgi:peptidyl-tRNA hydrolase